MGGSDVSFSVDSILDGLESSRDVLKKIRSRRRKGSGKKDKTNNAENRLLQSLRRAAVRINEEYVSGLKKAGTPYEKGDATARSELGAVLLELDAGLVDTIAGHSRGRDSFKPRLDYKILTTLSENCRLDVVETLASLRKRFSRARPLKTKKPSRTVDEDSSSLPKRQATGKYFAGVKQDVEITFEYVRPKTKRKASGLSASAGPNGLTRSATRSTSTLTNASTVERKPSKASKQASKDPLLRTAKSSPQLRQGAITPDRFKARRAATPPPASRKNAAHPERSSSRLRPTTPSPPVPGMPKNNVPPVHPGQINRPAPPQTRSPLGNTPSEAFTGSRKRRGYNIESFHSFTSNSTKLGEIPMRRWRHAFDFAEAGRLNALEESVGWSTRRVSPRRRSLGLWARMFKRPVASVSKG